LFHSSLVWLIFVPSVHLTWFGFIL